MFNRTPFNRTPFNRALSFVLSYLTAINVYVRTKVKLFFDVSR